MVVTVLGSVIAIVKEVSHWELSVLIGPWDSELPFTSVCHKAAISLLAPSREIPLRIRVAVQTSTVFILKHGLT